MVSKVKLCAKGCDDVDVDFDSGEVVLKTY